MHLPGSERAFIPPGKLTGYLPSREHPHGGSKAEFFLGLGFTAERAFEMELGLLEIAPRGQVTETKLTVYGMKYVIPGTLSSPTTGGSPG